MEPQDLSPDPLTEFSLWLRKAEMRAGLEFPHAVALATSTRDGRPSVRIVLFKGLNNNCFSFFTNYDSRKGRELESNPFAALCFFWEKLGRQVRVEGSVTPLSAADSDAYFRMRPRGSRIGAWASPQSREIPSRDVLEEKVRELEAKYGENGEIPRPARWGGFALLPERMEFWKNGMHRLHDRVEYTRNEQGAWTKRRLAP